MMVEKLEQNVSADKQDALSLFEFVIERKRPQSEIDGFINSLAHQKYTYSKTQEGHELRMRYKNWLRFQLRKMLRKHYFENKVKPNNLNNSNE
jgi:hypothetical protein